MTILNLYGNWIFLRVLNYSENIGNFVQDTLMLEVIVANFYNPLQSRDLKLGKHFACNFQNIFVISN